MFLFLEFACEIWFLSFSETESPAHRPPLPLSHFGSALYSGVHVVCLYRLAESRSLTGTGMATSGHISITSRTQKLKQANQCWAIASLQSIRGATCLSSVSISSTRWGRKSMIACTLLSVAVAELASQTPTKGDAASWTKQASSPNRQSQPDGYHATDGRVTTRQSHEQDELATITSRAYKINTNKIQQRAKMTRSHLNNPIHKVLRQKPNPRREPARSR